MNSTHGKTIPAIQNAIIQEFREYTDWLDIYDKLIKRGKSLAPIDDKLKTDTNSVSGCQSQVWITATVKEGRIYFYADSDTVITRGLICLLLEVLHNQPVEDVAGCDLFFIAELGFQSNLSPSRSNGLMAIIAHMKSLALKFIDG